ncbi:L-seryl-tRNA(Sec) selenium transferase [Kocuria coralli]|uniref:L-seryl-tRNA(Sec) selenium transferase n=1 Tax=Kocuria coralli TaxID=1461025 RepID=A0A5J5L0W8_9MICC|nr:L-seryl-tRNA(Sec) selenium transferase [Kocuria coralli]KAA9394835.1 L-seryl-tRNA(Sec) selenium transferase [Kocuria coralli]
MAQADPRRRIPRTDRVLDLPEVVAAREHLSEATVRALIQAAQERARAGEIAPEDVIPVVVEKLSARSATTLSPVLNATGIVVHTNLGRAPLSPAARQAVRDAAGYVDVEMDLVSGRRSRRGSGAREALLAACPAAEDALVVNNGAAALVLATTALAAGREVLISRGEFVEIGAGFRLSDLMASTGAVLREVGTTNRTHLSDYEHGLSERTGCILKVHTSNFRVEGFTSAVGIAALRPLADRSGVPVVADVGSGLLHHDPLLPDEPDLTTALEAGADLVIASGDKLLGGPQTGLLLGSRQIIQKLARHPLARAVRCDKLALAALEATLSGTTPPVTRYLHADPTRLRERAERLASLVGARMVPHDGRVGGGAAPGVPLPGWAVELPESLALPLRTGAPAVVARVHDGSCLIDLRCIPEDDDGRLAAAVLDALTEVGLRPPSGRSAIPTPPSGRSDAPTPSSGQSDRPSELMGDQTDRSGDGAGRPDRADGPEGRDPRVNS